MPSIPSLLHVANLSTRRIGYFVSIFLFGLYTVTVLGALFLKPGTPLYYYFTDVLLPVKAAVIAALVLHVMLLAKEVTARKPWDQRSEHLIWSLAWVGLFGYASYFALTQSPLSGSSYWSLYTNLDIEVRLGVTIAFLYAFGFILISLPKEASKDVIRFHEHGRLPLRQKVAFFRSATEEIIEVGVSLRTLVGYFDQRPQDEFKKPVVELLRNGRNFRFLLLDPDSDNAKKYAEDRSEPELIDTIRRSIEKLSKLRDEFSSSGSQGKFEIQVYSHFPSCYMMLVDPATNEGRLLVSHYLHSVKRADTPVVEIHKSRNPILFDTYHKFVTSLSNESRKL